MGEKRGDTKTFSGCLSRRNWPANRKLVKTRTTKSESQGKIQERSINGAAVGGH